MEYCYEDWDRKCVCGGIEAGCAECGRVISDCEWVSNWTLCRVCMDAMIEAHEVDD